MREILFRGKTEQGEWLYGFYHNETSIESPSSDRKVTRHHIYTQNFDKFVIPETIGQFTGLTDKNGKKIFEGDIVRYTRTNMFAPSCSFHKQDIVSHHKILWDSSVSAFCSIHYSLQEKRIIGKGSAVFYDDRAKENIIEVIGNIYDNKELLGE